MTIAPFTLKSATTNAAAPFSLGHAFKKGEVPVGSELIGPFADLQVVPKNYWTDGSLKFAVVSGRASLTANVALSVQLSIGAPAVAAALTTADLKATLPVASIGAGAFGTVSWATTDWDTPFKTVISGPKMSSWVYRKQVGTDAHLVGWLEVRLFSGGEVEILPWIENGYLKVAGPTNKSATYTFTMGTERFSLLIDLKHHQRTVLINGAALSYWKGADPGVTVSHDKAYLQATELVPTYSAEYDASVGYLSSTPSNHDSLISTFTPLARGNFKYDSDSMQSGGYQAPIGLLPTHDVAYLTGDTLPELRYGAVIRNGFVSGRYSIHYRDEVTQRPPAFSTYPTLVIADAGSGVKDVGASTNSNYTPAVAGGSGPQYDCSHHPSIAYLAYLLTGWFYFKEEIQFAATINHFHTTDWVRGGGTGTAPIGNASRPGYTGASGLCTSMVQTRHGVWAFRTLVQALAITPFDDPLHPELVACVEANCRFHSQIYVEQANNQFGLVHSNEVYTDVATDRRMIPIWQHDFGTAVWGMAKSLDLPISATAKTQMSNFFAWKAKSIVHRLGTAASGFRFERAGVYEYSASPSTTTDFLGGAGPWYASEAEAFTGTMVGTQNRAITNNTLDYADLPTIPYVGVWGNLVPAIAYAVRHAVAGAEAAYNRLVSASNWAVMATGFNEAPAWSVEPASVGVVATSGFTGPVIRVESTSMIPGMIVCGERGLGIPGSSVPGAGTHGPSPVFNDLTFPADNTSLVMWRITQWPATGTLTVYEDCSFTFAPASTGTETFKYQLYINGAAYGQPQTVTMLSGVSATAPNAPTVSLQPGYGQVIATVAPPAYNGSAVITSYRVYLSDGNIADGPGPQFTLTASSGVPVSATATATNSAGTSPMSAPSATVTPTVAPTTPAAPTGVVATPYNKYVLVTCTTPYTGGAAITSYTAVASTGQTVTSATLPINVAMPNDVGASFIVRATNSVGSSVDSAPSLVVMAKAHTVTVTLVDIEGGALGALVGLRWAWFDQPSPGSFAAPTGQGIIESSDAAGDVVIDIPDSALLPGQVGWLVITSSDGIVDAQYKSFAGPVTVQ